MDMPKMWRTQPDAELQMPQLQMGGRMIFHTIKFFPITKQFGLFIDRNFDPDDERLFAINRMSGWLDWKVCIFGLDLNIWIERTS